MPLSPNNNQPTAKGADDFSTASKGVSAGLASVARLGLELMLASKGIRVPMEVGPTEDGNFGVVVKLSLAHGLTETQILEVKSLRTFRGAPVNVVVASGQSIS